jgi:hypothetical protein
VRTLQLLVASLKRDESGLTMEGLPEAIHASHGTSVVASITSQLLPNVPRRKLWVSVSVSAGRANAMVGSRLEVRG